MSRIFYDHYIKFERLEIYINEASATNEEKHELWELVDKLIHIRIIHTILNLLPHRHHEEFSELLHKCPYDKKIIKFLNDSAEENIETCLQQELQNLEKELLRELLGDEKEI